jgi:6-phospho-beta-glucosidase
MPALAILGGSTPFTVSLLDLLPNAGRWDVTLHGRDAEALRLIAGFGHCRLQPQGGTVRWTTDLDDALAGADVVLHQIRYGDLVGRAGDELLAESLGVAGDETLGPSGLRSAIRMAPALDATARAMARQCPDAWIVNLTNPLSCSTAILVRSGLRNVIGLCELPQFTLQQACAALNLSPDAVTWDYAGLNHRGFIHVLEHAGRNVLDDLPAALGDRKIGGIGAEDIAELGAVPLKYFRLLAGRNRTAERRAQALLDLKAEALAELRIRPTQVPAALRKRQMTWYPDAVMPVLRTLASGKAGEHVLNLPAGDGIVREFRAILGREGAEPLPSRPAQGAVRRWLERFEAHEQATLAAVLDPVRPRIREALALDPMLPAPLIDRAADLIAHSKAAGVQADA